MLGQLEVKEPKQKPQERLDKHIPVMLNEVLEYLCPCPGDIFIDGTLGMGGHARAVLENIGPQGRLIGIDRDEQSLMIARDLLSEFNSQINFQKGDFRNIDEIISSLNINKVNGILLDLGISSFQLDNPHRGFSLRADGPLDMRMDPNSYISAYDLVNSLSEKELSLIIKDFGQERWHHRIAHNIVAKRKISPIETTQELGQIILKSIPFKQKRERIHPATRTFQALRIAVNRELEALGVALEKCVHYLTKGGRVAVISFHSLEDKIVKNKFQEFSQSGLIKCIVKKPLRPNDQESNSNPRARSARLRIAERL